MSREFTWQPGDGRRWLRAFALPALPWIAPFLGPMCFPASLTGHQEMWVAIEADVDRLQNELWEANKELGYIPELDAAITQEVVSKALAELGARQGQEAADEFRDWAYQNVVRSRPATLLWWRVILRNGCGEGNPSNRTVPIPVALARICPVVCPLVAYDVDEATEERLRLVSPPSPEEVEENDLDMSSDALDVNEIIRDQTTLAALSHIAQLPPDERQAIISWAEQQAVEQQIRPESLCSDEIFDEISATTSR
jgi:hypothetical protein